MNFIGFFINFETFNLKKFLFFYLLSLLIIFRNDGNEVLIDSGLCSFQLPPNVKAEIILIIKIL